MKKVLGGVGLALGKFAPFHAGHQFLIETALNEVSHLIVMIYDMPDLPIPPLPVRANWIRRLYPQVEVLEAWGGPTETSANPIRTAEHDAFILQRLAGRRITHFYSSEFYGEHVSRALGAVDRRVDDSRTAVAVSATKIRKSPFDARRHLHPEVYRDLVTQAVLLGAPSTGKTTLARALATQFQTSWMPEYGREFWEANQVNRRLSQEQLFDLACGHRQREDLHLMEANQFFFIDTDATTTLQFSFWYHESADARLVELADQCRQRYDLFFVCDTDIPYEETWDRSGNVSRELMQRRILSDLQARKTPFALLHGSLEQRLEQVSSVLGNFQKFGMK